jgi:hypothetical protein
MIGRHVLDHRNYTNRYNRAAESFHPIDDAVDPTTGLRQSG